MANKVYTVKSGDSLTAIAKKHNTTVSAILKANPTIAKRREAGKVDIYSGSKVKVPGTGAPRKGPGSKAYAEKQRTAAAATRTSAAQATAKRVAGTRKQEQAMAARGGTKPISPAVRGRANAAKQDAAMAERGGTKRMMASKQEQAMAARGGTQPRRMRKPSLGSATRMGVR